MKPIIYPYKVGSASAKALAAALNTKQVRENGRYTPFYTMGRRRGTAKPHIIINWGNPRRPHWRPANEPRLLNLPANVERAIDKLQTYQLLQAANVNIPEFTQDRATAAGWLHEKRVVGRSLIRGSGGRGITVHEPTAHSTLLGNEVLWQKYVTKEREYRVHVFQGRVIDTQIKRRRNGTDGALIRNLANGYVFCRDGIEPSNDRDNIAIAAVAALGLDFGATDLIWNRRQNRYYVLEVNTAPGLEGTTLERYSAEFRRVAA
jgi:glutathione synthase/RimK-type ligase-like ATP-grasp enzyme